LIQSREEKVFSFLSLTERRSNKVREKKRKGNAIMQALEGIELKSDRTQSFYKIMILTHRER
jgi:hypothetical protein